MPLQFTIWVDVEDLFQYFDHNKRPSGIQRLVYEILRVLEAQAALRPDPVAIRLTRRDDAGLIRVVERDAVDALFADTMAPPPQDAAPAAPAADALPAPLPPDDGLRNTIIRRLEALPPEIGAPLIGAAVNQLRALRLLARYARSRVRPVAATPPQAESAVSADAAPSQDAVYAPAAQPAQGDVYLILGATWSESDFGDRLRTLRTQFGLQPVLLLYDLIPALRPEWCARSLVQDFRHWLATTLPQCGHLLAISRSTAESASAYAAREGLALQAPIRAIPIGSGFGTTRAASAERPRGLPASGSYVLFVSTLEARKNHLLLFHVWRRLVTERPIADIPTLVFAGRVGWLVADLMQQLENTDWLRGKIRLIRDPSDDELAHLYDGCLFTLFPSLFEGWGLPVTESLMAGRPCIASSATSVPEAGGALTRYFDPENVDDAYDAIVRTLSDRDDLARWRESVARDFRPVPWAETADAVLDACVDAHALAAARPPAAVLPAFPHAASPHPASAP